MARLVRYRKIEVQVGIFAVLGTLALVFGLLWLRDFRFAKRYHEYKATFIDSGGLVPGDLVMVSGFRKGIVQKMRLLDRGVEVELAIERDVILRTDARAVIGTKGLLGERFVALERGKEEAVLTPGSTIQGDVAVGMAELMADTGELVRSARAASDDVRRIIDVMSKATQDSVLKRGVRDAAVAAHEMRTLLETNREAFHNSIANFERASASLADISAGSKDNIEKLTHDMRSAATKLDHMLDSLSTTADKTDRVASLLLAKDSTFGKMVGDPSLYRNLERVTARTDSLIADIQAHPHRYFKFSLF